MKNILILFFSLTANKWLFAQKDTIPDNTRVTIISSYKPTLPTPVKINFMGTQLSPDTLKRIQPYQIPSQSLYYRYQSINLNPLSLPNEPVQLQSKNSNYLKVGYGGYSSPLVAFAYGNPLNTHYLYNVYLDYTSSKGSIVHQDFSGLSIKTNGSWFNKKNELYTSVGYSRNQQYLYGYDHSLKEYPTEALSQLFQRGEWSLGFRNSQMNQSHIQYNPNLHIQLFNKSDSIRENTVKVDFPFSKKINNQWNVDVRMSLDATTYTNKGDTSKLNETYSNQCFYIQPVVIYKYNQSKANIGVVLVSDNRNLILLPDVKIEYPIWKEKLLFQSAITGSLIKNTFSSLSQINPFLIEYRSPINTKKTELYGGLKTNITNSFSVSIRSGILLYRNSLLFNNDTSAADRVHMYVVKEEKKMNHFITQLEVKYVNQDNLTVAGTINFNRFYNLQSNAAAWNMIPLEGNVYAQWVWKKKVTIRYDAILFSGIKYLEKGDQVKTKPGAVSANVSSHYQIHKRLAAFLQLNNIFGNTYERWNRYPAYGFNAIAGITCTF